MRPQVAGARAAGVSLQHGAAERESVLTGYRAADRDVIAAYVIVV